MKDVWPKVEKAGLKEIQVSKSKGQRSRTQLNTGQDMLRNHLLQNLNAHSNLLVSDTVIQRQHLQAKSALGS